MFLPKFLQPYLASYDLSQISKSDKEMKKEIITQILNLGDKQAIKWVFENYKDWEIKESITNPIRGVWLKRSLFYWKHILEIEISKTDFEMAIANLDPIANTKLYENFYKTSSAS